MSQKAGPRIVAKYVEGIGIDFDADATPPYSIKTSGVGTVGPASGWTLADSTNGIIQWQGYIDLSGYRPDDMVLLPEAVQCQYGGAWYSASGSGLAPGGEVHFQYAMTTDKIDDLDYGLGGVTEPLAGFIGDNSEMDQVVYSVTEGWGPNAEGVGMHNYQKHVTGDGPAIVGPRIYIAIRANFNPRVTSGSTVDTLWTIPPMRFVIAGQAVEVKEYQLLHLMKRQIDLQQTPDVDV
jgi:hypothetical protein